MQILRVVALLVSEIWRHKISLEEGNESSNSAIYAQEYF